MKNYPVLVLLLIAGILFFSCNESEIINNSLPIRSELPLCRFTLNSLDSIDKDTKHDLLSREAYVIQSEANLEAYLTEIETYYDKDFRKKYPEYTSVDFSKYTMIVHSFLDPCGPQNFISSKSSFYDRDNVSDNYKSEDCFYYWLHYRSYYSGSDVLDETPPLIYISGIVVDKIPANEKVMSAVTFGLTTSKK